LCGSDTSLDTTVSYLELPHIMTCNVSSTYEAPKHLATWDKKIRWGNETSCVKSSLVSNNDTLYTFEANYSNVTGEVIESNSTFVLHNHEDDAEYPYLDVLYSQKFNFSDQSFFVNVSADTSNPH